MGESYNYIHLTFWIIFLAGIGTLYNYIYRKKRVRNIKDKAVFITGCDTGFGRALAIQLNALGCPVFAGCFTEEGAANLRECASKTLQTLSLDVRLPNSIRSAFQFVTNHMPEETHLWGIVNNAGIATYGVPAEFLLTQHYEEMIKVNYIGPVDLTLTFLPLIKKVKGRIVNMSSLVARMPTPLCAAYAGSKSALHGFSEVLRREKASSGIKVSTIIPGHYHTEITNPQVLGRKIQDIWNKQPDELKQEYNEKLVQEMLEGYVKISTKYSNTNLSQVTNAVEHALFAVNPYSNYKCGLDSKVFCFMESLPFGILEYIQSKTFTLAKILCNRINKLDKKDS